MGKLHIQTYGSGKPIVLVHGWAMHGGIWRQFAQGLAENFRVICIDLPGHGHSPTTVPYSLAAISTALAAAIDEPVCCWLGWSLGALVVLDIARRFPERVGRLVLLAGTPCFTKTDAWPGMDGRVLDSFAESLDKDCRATLMRFLSLQLNQDLPDQRALLKGLKAAVLECPVPDSATLAGALKILKSADLRSVLTGMDKPIAAILGDRDMLVPVSVGQHLQALAPSLELTVLDKAGHVPFLSHQTELLGIISRFMERP